jgi:hypothetical protein
VVKASDHRSILPRAARAAQAGGPRRRLVQLPSGHPPRCSTIG